MNPSTLLRTIFAAGALATVSCSSSTDPDPQPTPEPETGAAGVVRLPPGFAGTPDAFDVLSPAGDADVDAAGAFRVAVPGDGPSMVLLVDADDRPVLVGYVDRTGDATTPGEISAHETAAALLYYALRVFTLPDDGSASLLPLIRAHPATEVLADSVAAALAADSGALRASGSPLLDDIAAAVAAITKSEPRPGPRASRRGDDPGITIDPLEPQSGVRIEEAGGAPGLQVRNERRRNAWYFVYKTGYEDFDGNEFEIDPPELVGDGFVGPTSRLLGGAPHLLDWTTGLAGFEPAVSAPIPLAVESFESEARFEAFVAGGYMRSTTGFPDWYDSSNPRHVALGDRAEQMLYLTLVKDLLAPAVFGAGSPLPTLHPDVTQDVDLLALAELGSELLTEDVPALVLFNNGDWAGTVARILGELDDSELLRDTVLEIVTEILGAAGLQDRVLQRIAELTVLTEGIERGLVGIDAGNVVADNTGAERIDRWDVTSRVAFGLTANRTILTPNHIDAIITAEVEGLPNASFCYLWTIEGIGELSGFAGGTASGDGATLVTSDPQVQYLIDPVQLTTGLLATIRCEAFVHEGGACADPPTGDAIGEASIDILGGACDLVARTDRDRLYPAGLGNRANIQATGCDDISGPFCVRWEVEGSGFLREIEGGGQSVDGVLESTERVVAFEIEKAQIVEGGRSIVRAKLYNAACGAYDPEDPVAASAVVLRHDPFGDIFTPCEDDFDYAFWSEQANDAQILTSGFLGGLVSVNVILPDLPKGESSFTTEVRIPRAGDYASAFTVVGDGVVSSAGAVLTGGIIEYSPGHPGVGVVGALVRVVSAGSFSVTIPTDAYPKPCEESLFYDCCPRVTSTEFGDVLIGPYVVTVATSGTYRGAIVQAVDAATRFTEP